MKKLSAWIDGLGLSAIAVVLLGYVLFQAQFAELHLKFSFLNFPVFVGEILLIFCSLLFAIRWLINPPRWRNWYWLIVIYIGFVLAKAFYGYSKWGPLAFRHAALMYYPVFAIYTAAFIQRSYFKEWLKLVGVGVILSIFVLDTFNLYFVLTLAGTAAILIGSLRTAWLRWSLLVLLMVLTPYRYFFQTARMMIMGHFFFAAYALIVISVLIRWPLKYKLAIAGVLVAGLIVGITQISGTNRIVSMFHVGRFIDTFKYYEGVAAERAHKYVPMENKAVQIYNPDDGGNGTGRGAYDLSDAQRNEASLNIQHIIEQKKNERDSSDIDDPEILQGDVNNSVFRLMIWRDMLREYAAHRPLFGFDFGKPLRAITLEIIGWAGSEWKRDGWISAHNSFLHILYRSGVAGLVFIVGILSYLFKMMRDCIRLRSVTGSVLCGMVLCWFVAANFLVVLEVPYSAIPIWVMYGAAAKYCHVKKQQGIQPEEANEVDK